MNKKIKLFVLTAVISIGLGLGTNAAVKTIKTPAKAPIKVEKTITPVQKKVAPAFDAASYESVNSLTVAANPTKYLNKKIKIKATFDKFSTLGLDYKPAYRSSEKYITFLIKRDDVTNHTIPLSEMKNFLDRDTAEKYIELSSGDVIEYYGTVFSTALGDTWVNVDKFNVLSQKPKEIKK